MQIIPLDGATISHGLDAFDAYRRAKLCGPRSGEPHGAGLNRATGPRTLPGIISGCIDHGLDTFEEIVWTAAAASRCRLSTVRFILSALTGSDRRLHLWSETDDQYRNLRDLSRLDDWTVPAFMAA